MKIAFVRNPKTGSSSMRRALPGSVLTDAHEGLAHYKRSYPKVVTFAFVRDPWERTFSWWRHQNYCKTQSFRDYVMHNALQEEYVHGKYNMGMLINDQFQWICHEDQYADHIGRFESMEEDFMHIVEHLNIELVEPLQHRNKSIRRETYPHSDACWDEEMVQHMEPLFGPFAELFGYRRPCL